MPKVTLLNTETKKLQSFEPVDAREVLANPNTIYEVPKRRHGPAEVAGVMPQQQGDDAELTTGLPVEKYGRSNVVRAEPGMADTFPAEQPQKPRKRRKAAKRAKAPAKEAAKAE